MSNVDGSQIVSGHDFVLDSSARLLFCRLVGSPTCPVFPSAHSDHRQAEYVVPLEICSFFFDINRLTGGHVCALSGFSHIDVSCALIVDRVRLVSSLRPGIAALILYVCRN